MKKLVGVIFVALISTLAFAGDAAFFVDEGFSKDGSVYVFGQYGKTDKSFNSYAEIYTVDVAKNEFIPGGIFRTQPGKAPANESGFTTYEKLSKKSAYAMAQYDLRKTSAENLLYFCDDESVKGSELIEFQDFEISPLTDPVKWQIKLVPTIYGSGANISSSFYILIKELDSAGNFTKEYQIGNPSVKRANVADYKIEKIVRDESKKNLVFVIEKTVKEGNDVSFRYMVETFTIK